MVSAHNNIYQVKKNDTLWGISKKKYNTPFKWTNIEAANINKIKDPNYIYPKQRFIIPSEKTIKSNSYKNTRPLGFSFSQNGWQIGLTGAFPFSKMYNNTSKPGGLSPTNPEIYYNTNDVIHSSSPTIIYGVTFGKNINSWSTYFSYQRVGDSDVTVTRVGQEKWGHHKDDGLTRIKSDVFMLNTDYHFFSLTFHHLIPFIGIGIGTSYNQMAKVNETNQAPGTGNLGDNEYHLAFSGRIGLTYNLSKHLNISAEYAYLYLGNYQSSGDYRDPGTGIKSEKYTRYSINNVAYNNIQLTLNYLF